MRIISVSGIGSARRLTNYRIDTDEIWCGCFKGTLAEFEAKIDAEYKNGQHRNDYMAAVAFFKACKGETK